MANSKPRLLACSGIRGLYYFKGKYYCWGVEITSHDIYLDLDEFRVRIPELENFNYFQTATIQKKLFPKSILAIVGKHTVNYQKILNAYLAEEDNSILSFANGRQLIPRYVFERQTEDRPQEFRKTKEQTTEQIAKELTTEQIAKELTTKAQIAEEKAAKLAKQATRNQRRK